MSYLDDLNALASGTQASEKNANAGHPLCENAPGMVMSVEQKRGKKNPDLIYYDLTIKTKLGTTWSKIFDVTEKDVEEAMANPERKQSLGGRIAKYKRYFTDLGVATPETVATWKWRDDSNPGMSLLHQLQNLAGKHCSVSVVASYKKPGETMVFFGSPNPNNLYGQEIPAATAPAQAPTAYTQAPGQANPVPVYAAPPAQVQPGSQPNLDAIPF